MLPRAAVIVVAAALLLGAEFASGGVVTRLDRAGRPMTFDVRAQGVNVNWYARGSAAAAAVVTRLGAARTC